jgi:hypothetical protein
VTTCCCSHLVVCLVYCWWILGVGFGYVQDYDIVMLLLTFDVDLGQCSACFSLVIVCRCKHSTWLRKLKWLILIKI